MSEKLYFIDKRTYLLKKQTFVSAVGLDEKDKYGKKKC